MTTPPTAAELREMLSEVRSHIKGTWKPEHTGHGMLSIRSDGQREDEIDAVDLVFTGETGEVASLDADCRGDVAALLCALVNNAERLIEALALLEMSEPYGRIARGYSCTDVRCHACGRKGYFVHKCEEADKDQ